MIQENIWNLLLIKIGCMTHRSEKKMRILQVLGKQHMVDVFIV